MIAVHDIAAATKIVIIALRRQHIVNLVINSFKRKSRSQFISFRCMVKYHVQNDFDALVMQFADQPFQLIALMIMLYRVRIAGVWRKITDRIISPVIEQLVSVMLSGRIHLIKFKDRHQLDRIDPKLFQIRDLFTDSLKGSFCHNSRRRINGKSTHMHLIDDQILQIVLKLFFIAPVKVIFYHPRLIDVVGTEFFAPVSLIRDCLRIRVENNTILIKTMPLRFIIRTVKLVCIFKILNI